MTAATYTDVLGPSLTFAEGRMTTTRYLQLAKAPNLVLALRGSVGSLVGAERDEVPADGRFTPAVVAPPRHRLRAGRAARR